MVKASKIKAEDELLVLKIKLFKIILILFGLMTLGMSITHFYEQAYYQFFVDVALILVILTGYLKLKYDEKNWRCLKIQ